MEIDKPIYTHCPHECHGCAIYMERPSVCREFECLWLQGLVVGDDRRRPDRLGLIFTQAKNDEKGSYPMLLAWEVAPGRADVDPARYILSRLEQVAMFVLKRWPVEGQRRHELRGPRSLTNRFAIQDIEGGFQLLRRTI